MPPPPGLQYGMFDGQGMLQPPQCFGSRAVSTHACEPLPEQSVYGEWQVHFPLTQVCAVVAVGVGAHRG